MRMEVGLWGGLSVGGGGLCGGECKWELRLATDSEVASPHVQRGCPVA
jgi:hypothetical protein